MSKKNTEETPIVEQVAETPTPSAPEARVKFRVTENGISVAGGIAAKGKILNVKLSEAKTLESLGKGKIVGV